VPLFTQQQKLVAALLRVARVTAGLEEIMVVVAGWQQQRSVTAYGTTLIHFLCTRQAMFQKEKVNLK